MSFSISNSLFDSQTYDDVLTSSQLEMSFTLRSFCDEAASCSSILSLMTGQTVAAFAKGSLFKALSLSFGNGGRKLAAYHYTSSIIACGAEGIAFNIAGEVGKTGELRVGSWRENLHGFFTIGVCKLIGARFGRSIVLQHGSQDLGMMFVDISCESIGIAEVRHEGGVQRLLSAELATIRMGISARLTHAVCVDATYFQTTAEISYKSSQADQPSGRFFHIFKEKLGLQTVTVEGPSIEIPEEFYQNNEVDQKPLQMTAEEIVSEKKTSAEHSSPPPVIYIRESLPEDVPALLEVASSNQFRTLNFPVDPKPLNEKINKSQRSFRGELKALACQHFMFSVLSGTKTDAIAVGTSTFYPKHGTSKKPHSAYRVFEDHLLLTRDWDGPAEVGAMVLHRALQGRNQQTDPVEILIQGALHTVDLKSGYGRAASWVRFFWAGVSQEKGYYKKRTCLAEFLPPFTQDQEGNRTNAFYEEIGRKIFGRSYDKMDLATLDDHKLIRQLPEKIPLSELPEEVRQMIGTPGPNTVPAVRLLERVGFHYSRHIDPLDAGPHYEGTFLSNPLFMGVRYFYFEQTAEFDNSTNWEYGFIGRFDRTKTPAFEACAAPVWIDGEKFRTTSEVAARLKLASQDLVALSLFPSADGSVSPTLLVTNVPPPFLGRVETRVAEVLRKKTRIESFFTNPSEENNKTSKNPDQKSEEKTESVRAIRLRQETELARKIKKSSGSERERYLQQLTESIDPLIRSLAKRYKELLKVRRDLEDLVQEGRIGLLIALESYDPQYDNFTFWAFRRIKVTIQKFALSNSSVARRKKGSLYKTYVAMKKVKQELTKLDIESSPENLAKYLEIPLARVFLVQRIYAPDLSLDSPNGNKGSRPFIDFLPSPMLNPEQETANREYPPYIRVLARTPLELEVVERIMNPKDENFELRKIAARHSRSSTVVAERERQMRVKIGRFLRDKGIYETHRNV